MKNLKNILSDYTETATPPHPQSLQKIKRNKNNILYNSFSSLISIRNERGRTLTETVGVLAVMGILTIGAVTGYRYGINKYRSNQILQDIRLIYQEIKYPLTVQKIVETGTLPHIEADTQSAYEYNFTFPDLDNFSYNSTGEAAPHLLSVNVSGVPANVCDILLKNKPPYVLMLQVNTENVHSCEESENELNYIFEITSDSFEYGTCSVCSDNHCFDDDLNCPEGEYCYNNSCSECLRGYTENTAGTCLQCSNNWSGITTLTKENCLRCDNTTWISSTNKCYSCDKINTWSIKSEECNMCTHNPHITPMGNTTTGYVGCFNCNTFGYFPSAQKAQCEKCMTYNENIIFYPKDANGTSTTGLCTICAAKNADGTACICPDGQFWVFADGQHSFCRRCTESPNTYSSKTECDKCPQRYFLGTNERNGKCILCNGVSDWGMTKEQCDKCTAKNESTIAMRTNTTGSVGCFDCKTFGYYPAAEKAQCEKCMTYNENIIFYPKDANGTNTIGLCARCEMKNEDGTACICPNGQFWVFADGNHSFCRECTNQSGHVSTKIECDKCPNRYYATTNNDRSGSCQLCPTGKVKSSDGRSCVDAPAE